MRILLVSPVFRPSIGGIETASFMFASGLVARGYDVKVVTFTPGADETFPFEVVRAPGLLAMLGLVRWAHLVWHNQISLRALWPLALVRRPLILTHQTWLGRTGRGAIRRMACALGHNVYISRPLADDVGKPGQLIPNGYPDHFRLLPEIARDRDVVFLGRLIRDKGADIVIDAVAILKPDIRITATIVGDGPEAASLKARAAAAGVADQIVFAGPLQGEALVRELNRHRIMAVPSRFAEPFGIVSLEGIACGCVPVAASVGGLPQAVGPCGPLIPGDDPASLARTLKALLTDKTALAAYRAHAPEHLGQFTATAILDGYEAIIRRLTGAPDRIGAKDLARIRG